jgi:hydroxyacylglutathione hydrolase
VGYERRFNPALQYEERDAFVAYMTADQPSRPANMETIVAINQGRAPLTWEEPEAPRLTVTQLQAQQDRGAVIVDAREVAPFSAGHVAGAYNIQLGSSQFEQRVGWVVPPDKPLLLITADEAAAQEALHKLAFVGLARRVAGIMSDGIEPWLAAGLPVATLGQKSVQALQEGLQDGNVQVLDVRDTSEWKAGHIAGATHVPYKELEARLGAASLDPEKPIAVVCASGYRSSTASSILLQHGYTAVYNVTGGMDAWQAAALPVTR